MSDRKTYQKILDEQSGGKKLGTKGKPSGKATQDELRLDAEGQEQRMDDAEQLASLKDAMLKDRMAKSAQLLKSDETRKAAGVANAIISSALTSLKDSVDIFTRQKIDSLLERMMSLSEVRIPKQSLRDVVTNAGRLDGTVRSRGYEKQMGDSSAPPEQSTQSSTGSSKPPGQISVKPPTASPHTARDQSKNQQEFGEKLDAELQTGLKKQTTTEPARSTGNTGYDPAYLGLMASAAKKNDGSVETENTEDAAAKAAAEAAAKFMKIQGLVSGKTKK